MSQRHSEYSRQEHDLYETPDWVTDAVLLHLPSPSECFIWEPACGSGKMLEAIRARGFSAVGSDITDGVDFLDCECPADRRVNAIVTNPPFRLARQFIEHALRLMEPERGLVAMLLRTDYDHAKTRRHLFPGCPTFSKRLVLTKRIIWFDRPGAAPSFNHAWFIWDHRHEGAPVLAYGP